MSKGWSNTERWQRAKEKLQKIAKVQGDILELCASATECRMLDAVLRDLIKLQEAVSVSSEHVLDTQAGDYAVTMLTFHELDNLPALADELFKTRNNVRDKDVYGEYDDAKVRRREKLAEAYRSDLSSSKNYRAIRCICFNHR